MNASPRKLVANQSLYKDEAMLAKLGFPLTVFSSCEQPSQFVFVTAADETYFHLAVDAISNYQSLFPNNIIYFYDLSDGALDNISGKVRVKACITFSIYYILNMCLKTALYTHC